jgi:hypothetical protein
MMRRLSGLVLLSIAALALGQRQSWSWKEYVYADDGFAVMLPSAPVPHKDPANPAMNIYSVPFGVGSALSLRVDHQNRDCAAILAELKDGALKGKSGINPSSIKDVSVGGHAGLEYEYSAAAVRISSDRFYCINGHFYAFSVVRPISKSRPAALDRIINSFRIVNPAARNFAPMSLGDKKPDTGSVSGHVYRNEFFRFTYTFPEDFKPGALGPEAVRFFDGMNSFVLLVAGSNQARPASGELPSVVKVTAWSEPSLWGDGWKEKTGGDYLSRLGTMTNNLEPMGSVKRRKIAGVTFYEADAKTNPGMPALPRGFQKNIVRTTEIGYILQFVFEASSREELERLDHSIESLHFESQ